MSSIQTATAPAHPVLDLRPGGQVRQPCGAWFTVATRPKANRGSVLTWSYLGGATGRADWLARVPCRPARRKGATS